MIIDRMAVLKMWRECKIKDSCAREVNLMADHVFINKKRYSDVSQMTGVPWYVIGAIHAREASLNFNTYLGNGDLLSKVTEHVPKGRGPFPSWEDGAIDAIDHNGLAHLPSGGHWDLVTSLIRFESYNGWGYFGLGLPSPYVWACTNIQKPGKYVSDGKFDRKFVDEQPGCAAILLSLKLNHAVDLGENLPVPVDMKPQASVQVSEPKPVKPPEPKVVQPPAPAPVVAPASLAERLKLAFQILFKA